MKTSKNIVEKIKVTKLPKSQVEIEGTMPLEAFLKYRTQALESINSEITVDGFRKGKIPESTLVSKVGEKVILEEMAEIALSHAYPEILISEKIDAIGRPQILITKLAPENPFEFKITTTIVPDVALSDYTKIIQGVVAPEAEKATNADVEAALLRIRRSRIHHDHDSHDENMSEEEHNKLIDASLPEVTDEFAQSLGEFKNVSDMKEKVKEALGVDKKNQAKEKRRIAISDKLIENATIEIPDLLVDSEVRRIEAQFQDDIARMGVSLEDYLKHAKKTLEEIHAEWKPHGEKKAKLQLILNKIAEIEKIKADEKDIEAEVGHILEHYKDADRESAYTYAETVLTNEKVFQFLETL